MTDLSTRDHTIVHIIYRMDIGGLETVLVEFINRCPEEKYKHIIVSLTEITHFSNRITNDNVQLIALHKRPGKDFRVFFKILFLLLKKRPALVHTYNIPTLEYQFAAWLSRVPARVHAEHGRDSSDPQGTDVKYLKLRRFLAPFIHAWVPVSKDLERWLINVVKVRRERVHLIYNGVTEPPVSILEQAVSDVPSRFLSDDSSVIMTVGRLDPVKDQQGLILAFSHLLHNTPQGRERLYLAIIGGGALAEQLRGQVEELGIVENVWLAGPRDDVLALLRYANVFVLSSIAEGIPMTVLEAMSLGVPVVSTDVGGVGEIITNGQDGWLVPVGQPETLAEALASCLENEPHAAMVGKAGKETVTQRFSLDSMGEQYMDLYTRLINNGASK